MPAIGGHRGLPADCFGRGWVFGSARCGRERVTTLWGLSSGRTGYTTGYTTRGTNCLVLPYQAIWGGITGKSLAHVRLYFLKRAVRLVSRAVIRVLRGRLIKRQKKAVQISYRSVFSRLILKAAAAHLCQ